MSGGVVQLTPGKRISIEDITRVIWGNATVVIEEEVLLQVSKNFQLCSDSNVEIPVSADQLSEYDTGAAAGVLIRLQSLLSTTALISVKTLQLILALVNARLISTEKSNNGLALLLSGVGYAVDHNNVILPAKQVLWDLDFSDFKISTDEVKVLSNFPIIESGEATMSIACLLNVVPSVDVIVAFTAEAIGAQEIDLFDAIFYETNRPHRGMINSAGNIRALLEGSKRVGMNNNTIANQKNKSENNNNNNNNHVIYAAPQSTGPCLDTVNQLVKILETEINCVEDLRISSKNSPIFEVILQQVEVISTLLTTASTSRSMQSFDSLLIQAAFAMNQIDQTSNNNKIGLMSVKR
jgi:histidine ammonia-lyase